MSYSVDIAKPALTLLLEEFNRENNLNLTFDNVTFKNFSATGGPNGSSAIEISWITSNEYVGKVVLHYQRMDLAYLFSLAGLFVKEVDYYKPGNKPVVNARLLDNIKKRYRMQFNTAEFDFVTRDGAVYIQSNSTNVAYQGEVMIQPYIRDQLILQDVTLAPATAFLCNETIVVYPRG